MVAVTVPPSANLSDLAFETRDAHLGGGVSSGLHRVRFCGEPFLFKQYRGDTVASGEHLTSLIHWRSALPLATRRRLDSSAAFPVSLVTKAGHPMGVLVAEAPAAFLLSGGRRRSTRTFDDLTTPRAVAQRHSREYFEPPWRIAAMGHLAELLVLLHSAGVVVGDLNSKNVLVHPAAREPRIFLVDCDSVFLHGRSAFEVHDQQFLRCPWAPEDRFTRETDWFKFALMSIRVIAGQNNVNELDRTMAQQLMRTEHADKLAAMLVQGRTPSEVAAEALAHSWQARVSSSGRMWSDTDSGAGVWQPGRDLVAAPGPTVTVAGSGGEPTAVAGRSPSGAVGRLVALLALLFILATIVLAATHVI